MSNDVNRRAKAFLENSSKGTMLEAKIALLLLSACFVPGRGFVFPYGCFTGDEMVTQLGCTAKDFKKAIISLYDKGLAAIHKDTDKIEANLYKHANLPPNINAKIIIQNSPMDVKPSSDSDVWVVKKIPIPEKSSDIGDGNLAHMFYEASGCDKMTRGEYQTFLAKAKQMSPNIDRVKLLKAVRIQTKMAGFKSLLWYTQGNISYLNDMEEIVLQPKPTVVEYINPDDVKMVKGKYYKDVNGIMVELTKAEKDYLKRRPSGV